jgi:hypothetical protein
MQESTNSKLDLATMVMLLDYGMSLKHSAISFKVMPRSTGGIPRLFIYP